MKLKKGTYYVGDPSYIFNDSWDVIIHETDYFEISEIFGEDCCVGDTAYGDGTYCDNFGRKYNVDSGLIGILPISLINIDNEITIEEIEKSYDMHIIEFNDDFEVSISNGIFEFDDIIIDTKGSNSYEDEDYY